MKDTQDVFPVLKALATTSNEHSSRNLPNVSPTVCATFVLANNFPLGELLV